MDTARSRFHTIVRLQIHPLPSACYVHKSPERGCALIAFIYTPTKYQTSQSADGKHMNMIDRNLSVFHRLQCSIDYFHQNLSACSFQLHVLATCSIQYKTLFGQFIRDGGHNTCSCCGFVHLFPPSEESVFWWTIIRVVKLFVLTV
jgi:hypothetical protein